MKNQEIYWINKNNLKIIYFKKKRFQNKNYKKAKKNYKVGRTNFKKINKPLIKLMKEYKMNNLEQNVYILYIKQH